MTDIVRLDTTDAGLAGNDSDNADAKGGEGGRGDAAVSGSHPPAVKSSDFWSDRYSMDNKERGVAVIINNRVFNKFTGLSERTGADVDAIEMYDMYQTLGFEEIIQKDNLTVAQMKELLATVSKFDFSDKDCFSCAILSYGDEGYVYGTDDRVEVDDLVAFYKGDKCTSLAGKPKLFFIQACRATRVDAHDGESGEPVVIRRIPTEADFLMAYSVIPGCYSWGNSQNCSWFIQGVSDVIKKHWKELDLFTMMTRVNKKCAQSFQSAEADIKKDKRYQIPCITSMLTKDVFFTRKE